MLVKHSEYGIICNIYFNYIFFKEPFVGSFEDLTIIYNTVSMGKCVLRNQTLKPIDKLLEHKPGLQEHD